MSLHVCPILDQTSVDMNLVHWYLNSILFCKFCYLQNVKDKSKPVVPSKDSKELDKLRKRFLIPKNIQYYLLIYF